MRGRVAAVELMLLATVVIWAFNIVVTKYVLTHGFRPLAYASVRYGVAALLFAGLTVGLERPALRFWLAALLTFGGVALIALGGSGRLSADLGGNLLAIALAATWSLYSVAIAPLMRAYSPYRISAVVLLAMSLPLV